jgi:hypothetical protein
LASSINTEKGRIDAILSGADVNLDQFVEVVSYVNSIDLTNDNALLSSMTSIAAVASTETSRATAAEGSLASAMSTADASLAAADSRETSIRVAADASLATAVSAEATRAIAAEGSLATALAAEVTRATSVEAGLDGKILDILSNTDLTAVDSFTEVVEVINTLILANNRLNRNFVTEVMDNLGGKMYRLNINDFIVLGESASIYINGLLAIEGDDYSFTNATDIELVEEITGAVVVVKGMVPSQIAGI